MAARTDWSAAEDDAQAEPFPVADPKALLHVHEQLGAVATRAQLDERSLDRTVGAVAFRTELDDRLGRVHRFDLDHAGGSADDESDGPGDRECLAPHRRQPRVPRGGRTRTAGSCFGGRRSPMSFT